MHVQNKVDFHCNLQSNSRVIIPCVYDDDTQTALVMTHELGHNWGSPHDPAIVGALPACGVNIM